MKEEGFIYVLTNEELTICKIGFSKHPDKRLKQVQTGCPFKLYIYLIFYGDVVDEREIHKFFSNDSLYGEWFTFSENIKDHLHLVQVIQSKSSLCDKLKQLQDIQISK